MKNYRLTFPDKSHADMTEENFKRLSRDLGFPKLNILTRSFASALKNGVGLKCSQGKEYRLKII